MRLPAFLKAQAEEEGLEGEERRDRNGQCAEGASRETGQGEVGSAGSGGDSHEKSNSWDADWGVERDCSDCVEGFEEGERRCEETGNSEGVRVVRRAFGGRG